VHHHLSASSGELRPSAVSLLCWGSCRCGVLWELGRGGVVSCELLLWLLFQLQLACGRGGVVLCELVSSVGDHLRLGAAGEVIPAATWLTIHH